MTSRHLLKSLLVVSLIALCVTGVGLTTSTQDSDDIDTSVLADHHTDTENSTNVTAASGNGKAKVSDSSSDHSDDGATEGGNGKTKLGDSVPDSSDEDAAAGGNGKAKLDAPNNLTVSAPSFGEVPVGDTVVEEVQITNQGETSVTVEQIEIVGQDAGASEVREAGVPLEIAPGETVEVSVAFTPDEAGEMTAQMQITLESGDVVEVTLTGEGVPPETDDSPAPPPSEDTDTEAPVDTEPPTTDTPDEPDTPDTDPPAESGPDQPDEPDTDPPEQPDQPDTDTPDQPDEPGTDTPDQPDVPDTDTPEEPPTDTPEEPGTDTPEEPPTDTPEEPPTDTPEEPPTDTPEEPGTDTPEEPPTDTPEEPPTDTPEEPPTDTPEEPAADLAVTKTVNTTNATVGDNVAFTITVINNGPDTATNVTVNEGLGSGLAFQSAETTQGEYNAETSTYDVGTLEDGETATLTLVATIESAENTANTVEVSGNPPDPNEPNNNNTTDPGPLVADLSLTKDVNESSPDVGDNIEYTIDLTNNGPNATSNVSVEEIVPDGLTFVSADASQGSYDADAETWTVGELANGDGSTLTIVASVQSAENVTNTAQVNSSDVYDPDSTPDNDQSGEDDQDTVIIDGQQADLSVTKTVEESNATVGDDVVFTIDVTNNGPDTATNVSVYETFDSGLSFVNASATQGEYNDTTNVYDVGTLANGETATLTLTATIESLDNTTNAVEVTGDPPDPFEPNNNNSSDPDPDVVDLALTKTVNTTENVTVGDTVEFTVGVTNNGPDTATNVTVNEYPGEGLSFVSAETTQGSYDNSTGVYDVGTLDNGESATLTLVATITSSDDTENFVNGTSDQPDPTPPNNTTDPDPQVADLELTKSVNESSPDVGDNIEYTIDLTNNGPNAPSNVTVADTLSEDVSFVSSSAAQGSYDADTGIWTVGSMDSGAETTLTVVATVESSETITNTAEVNTSDLFDLDSTPGNDDPDEDDQDTVTIDGQLADLAVSKTVEDSNVTVGDDVEFNVTVTNNGPDAATNVSVYETLGSGLNFESAETTQGEYNADTGVYDAGTLETNETATLTLTATIESPTNTTNAVEVTGDLPDPNEPNNNNTTDPNPQVADLELAKTVNESTPDVGDNIEYTMDLTNEGPNATSNVTVEDALPDGVTFVSADASQGNYDASSGTWTVGDLANGDESTLTIVASVESTENVTNVAQVNSSDVFDPDSTPGNDVSEEDDQDNAVLNGQQADLALTKTVNTTENVTVGDTVEFTVGVTNNGPDTATNITVNEDPGEGLSFVSAETTQGSYDNETGVYDVGTLDNGESATLTIVATITSANDTENFVNGTSDQPDPTPPNNTTDPNPKVADLELTKDVNESTPDVGDNVAFTIDLTNTGPNATSNVNVEDVLPESVTFVDSTASQGSYDAETGLWSVGALEDGDSSTLTIVASVESAENVTNTAQVNTSDLFDPDSTPDNDDPDEDDQDVVTIDGQQADLAVTKTVDDTNATVGDNVEFTVDVTNNGPDAATNVTVNEDLGEGLSFVSAETTQGEYNTDTNVYEVGTLDSGSSATLTLTATIERADNTTNTAEVTGDPPDPFDPNNNNSSTPDPEIADLELTKNVNESTPNVGDNVAFTIDLTNNGPNATSNVTVEDALPDGLTFVDSTASQGSYDDESEIWTVGSLDDGNSSSLTIVTSVESAENVTNTAQVNTSDVFDSDSTPANSEPGEDDQDNATLNGQQADLALTKTVNTTENVTVGDTVEFTVGVTNNGPDTATNVTVNEYPGEGLSFESAEVTQGSYDNDTGVYDVGTLDNGESATLTIVSTITSPDDTENFVNATSDQPDPTPPNNSTDPNPKVADLELTKDVNESAPNVGENVEFTIDLTNNGPNATSNVTVEDALPEGVTFVSSSASEGSYDDSSGTWSVDELATGDSTALTIVASVESSANITNTAQVNTSDVYDPDSTPNNDQPDEDDQDTVVINGQLADLGVTKTVNNTNATVGDNVAFNVTVTNNGPDTATNVTVNEDLGEGLSFVSAETTQGSYNETTSVYDVGTLTSGSTAPLTLVATIESADNTTNTVEVTGGPPDPNDSNNNNSSDPNPEVADLELTKDVNESSPNVGDNIEYTINLTNEGPNATSNVTVEDALPDGVTFVSANASQGSYDAGAGTWTVGELATGDSTALTIVASVQSTENVTNTAQVTTSDVYDPDSTPGNNESGEDDQDNAILNGQQADLALTKTVNTTENVTVGDTVEFTVGVTNNGPDTATNVTVNEDSGEGLSFESAEVTQGSYDNGTGVYDVGTLDNGSSATLTIVATITSPDDTENFVNATSDQPDPTPPNNSTDPNPKVADLELTKTVNESAPDVGANVEFTIDLTNNGPNATSNVSVEDALPDGVTFVSSSASEGSYDDSSGTWSVGELATGDSTALTLVASVQSTENVTNTAQVTTSDVYDPDSTPGNNESGEDDQNNATLNGQQADLALTKMVNTTENVTVGDTVEFTVGVTNNGPDTATNVTVNEYPGEGLSFESAEVTQGSYDNDTGVYDVGTLDNGESATLTIVSMITSANDTENFVNATSDQPDPTPPNNTTDLNPQVADLELTKSVNETTPTVGDNVAFTIDLTNAGPNATADVSVEDVLPENVTFVSADASQGSYDNGTGSWTVGDLADGDSLTLTIVASVESSGDITNVAQVSSSEPYDPDSTPANDVSGEDDQDNATLTAQEQTVDLEVSKSVDDDLTGVGYNQTFTVDVTNNGSYTATNVVVEDRYNDTLSIVSSEASQGSFDEASGEFSVGSLAPGETATLTYTAQSTITYADRNVAEVTAVDQTDVDSTPGNDNASEDDQDSVASGAQPLYRARAISINQQLSLQSLSSTYENPDVVDSVDFDVNNVYAAGIDRDGDGDRQYNYDENITGSVTSGTGSGATINVGYDGSAQFQSGDVLQLIITQYNKTRGAGEILNRGVSQTETTGVNSTVNGGVVTQTSTLSMYEKAEAITSPGSDFFGEDATPGTYQFGYGMGNNSYPLVGANAGSSSLSVSGASLSTASSSTSSTASQNATNETPTTTTETASDNSSNTTTETQTTTTEPNTETATTETETATATPTDEPTETATETTDTTTETPTTTETETATVTTEIPTETATETAEPTTTANTTTAPTTEASPTTAETPTATENETSTETTETSTEATESAALNH